MSQNDKTCLPLIIYYMREKYYTHAEENLKLYNNDPVLRFFKTFATLMEGNTQEASRELLQLRDHPHPSLCSTVALIHIQQTSETIDLVEAVYGDRALYYTALLFWILELDLRARTCVEKMLKPSESSPEGLILKGWMMLTSDTEEDRPQAIRYFDSGVQDTGSVLGLMGKMEHDETSPIRSSSLIQTSSRRSS
ncbi:tetratricopeptide repeat protein 21B [Carassius gibelio]|uniref:tetratricopeptide repeat protein 21B n=1 Tax=Carassius gibelio TaxID=101364 RepID=UPI002278E6FF|nr:tetratricopeptide repeat protein 21B [Carassius gibelio]